MMALTVLAPIHQLLIFGNDDRFFDHFDLLGCFRFYFCEIEFVSAIGTVGEFELNDFIDECGCDRLSDVLFMTFLCTDFSFAPLYRRLDGFLLPCCGFLSTAFVGVKLLVLFVSTRRIIQGEPCRTLSYFGQELLTTNSPLMSTGGLPKF